MSDDIRSRAIQANPEFVNGKHFQDLVDIVNSYELDDLVANPIIRRISAFIGFKDSDMQDIADIQSKKDVKVMFGLNKDDFNFLKFGLGIITGYALGLFSYFLFNCLF